MLAVYSVYFLNGQLDLALSAYDNALRIDQNYALALYNKGNLLKAQRKIDEALHYYKAALEREPYFGDALTGWVTLLVGENKIDIAEGLLEQILFLRPDFPDAWGAMGFVMQKRGNFDDAVNNYRRALELKSGSSEILNNLGTALQALDRIDEAEECYRSAIQKSSSSALALNHLGTIMKLRGKLDDALELFTAAININGTLSVARWHRSTILLMQGKFDQGWDEYENRVSATDYPIRQPNITLWTGSSLKNKSILVYAEQGIGDEIMFASCFPDLINHAQHVVIDCAKKLEATFARSFPGATVRGASQLDSLEDLVEASGVDVAMPAGNLPFHFRKKWEEFPKHNGYITADKNRIAFWGDRLAALGPGLKVGISWKGGAKKTF